jgi:oxalate decarboxylase
MTRAAPPERPPAEAEGVGFLTLMTATAGYVDAIGFTEAGRLFLSFMSGNSTHLGFALAGRDWPVAGFILAVVAAFVAGSAAGARLLEGRAGPRPRRVLAAVAALLLAGAALAAAGRGGAGLLAATMAMGMQNALHQVVAGADIGRGFLSGNLFALGVALARLGREPGAGAAALQNAASWAVFVAGAAAGCLAVAALGLATALATSAAAVLAALFVLSLRRA